MKIKGSVSGKFNLCDGDGENHSSERLPCFLLFLNPWENIRTATRTI